MTHRPRDRGQPGSPPLQQGLGGPAPQAGTQRRSEASGGAHAAPRTRRPGDAPPHHPCAAMFWRVSSVATSSIEAVLDRDGFTTADLLDEDDLVQEARALNGRLLDHLRRPEVVRELVEYVVTPPSEGGWWGWGVCGRSGGTQADRAARRFGAGGDGGG